MNFDEPVFGQRVPQESPDQLTATDRALDVFGALTWDDAPVPRSPRPPSPQPAAAEDPLLRLLGALREDVEHPGAVPSGRGVARVVPLRPSAAHRRRLAVTAAVTGAVLSVSGVAAAGFSGPGTPLFPLHRAIFGPTGDEQALARVVSDLAAARRALGARDADDAGRDLDAAGAALRGVEPQRRGLLAADVEQLRATLAALSGSRPAGAPHAGPAATPAAPVPVTAAPHPRPPEPAAAGPTAGSDEDLREDAAERDGSAGATHRTTAKRPRRPEPSERPEPAEPAEDQATAAEPAEPATATARRRVPARAPSRHGSTPRPSRSPEPGTEQSEVDRSSGTPTPAASSEADTRAEPAPGQRG